MPEPIGAFALILHSHLPYVLEHNRLEEEWLFEAMAESYLPLIHEFRLLHMRGMSPKVTIGLTPVLLDQLADPRFAPRFVEYLQHKVRAAEADQRSFIRQSEHHLARLASLWGEFYQRTAAFFTDVLSSNFIRALRHLQKNDAIEVMTSAATHAYLPLQGTDESIRTQIAIGTASYQRHFGTQPQGFWLPECAYRPARKWTSPFSEGEDGARAERSALDQLLAAAGLHYFIADTRQLRSSPPDYAQHSPCRIHWVDGQDTTGVPVAVFTRDFETTARVWQHDTGYPGDPAYLEFHKKQSEGGLRYWRITDRRTGLAYKQPYVPEWAFAQVRTHAAHFAQVLRERLVRHRQQTGERGIVVAAFDTELFGHWWFEGPQWVSELLRQLTVGGDIALTTCRDYLQHSPPQHTVQLIESSWGDGGDHRVWWQSGTQSLWRDLYDAEGAMQQLIEQLSTKKLDAPSTRLLQQCARELLLLQSSDWPFMISTGSTPDHAQSRFALHYQNFQWCRALLERLQPGDRLPEEADLRLTEMERQNGIFRKLDLAAVWHGNAEKGPGIEGQGSEIGKEGEQMNLNTDPRPLAPDPSLGN